MVVMIHRQTMCIITCPPSAHRLHMRAGQTTSYYCQPSASQLDHPPTNTRRWLATDTTCDCRAHAQPAITSRDIHHTARAVVVIRWCHACTQSVMQMHSCMRVRTQLQRACAGLTTNEHRLEEFVGNELILMQRVVTFSKLRSETAQSIKTAVKSNVRTQVCRRAN